MPTDPPSGVYVEEAGRGPRSIEAVDTSTVAFFGVAPNAAAALRQPTPLVSYPGFQQTYCDAPPAKSTLATAVAGFFANGGKRCYVVNVGATAAAITSADLQLVDTIDDISIVAAPGFTDAASHEALLTNCKQRRDRFAILDTPKAIEPLARLTRPETAGDGLRPRSSAFAAVYAPWLITADAVTGEATEQPPSGHVAGIYARTDTERGVFKAPANVLLNGVTAVTLAIRSPDQDMLNPAGVNCIRTFPDGIRVWGARTLSDARDEWRYVSVRRLVTMIEQSILRGTQWAVFEPNDATLWSTIRREINAFLNALWRSGALMGNTANDAWFVKCDTTTMTQADIDAGRAVVLLGIAMVRPAEFTILRMGIAAGPQPV